MGGIVSHLQLYTTRLVHYTYSFITKGGTVSHLQLYHQACSLHLLLYHQRWNTFTLHLQLYHQRWETLLHYTYNITTKDGTHFYITPTTLPPKVGQLCYRRWGGFVLNFQQLYQVMWDRLCSLCLQLFCWLRKAYLLFQQLCHWNLDMIFHCGIKFCGHCKINADTGLLQI